MSYRSYRVLETRILTSGWPDVEKPTVMAEKGDIVYDQHGYDYGLASDDTRMTGIEHISVTKNSDGSYPGFTIPVKDLEVISAV